MSLQQYMHVGIAQIFPWRPHVQQRDFLLDLAIRSGAETSELVCNGSLTRCYDKQYHSFAMGSVDNCLKCRLGRGRSTDPTQRFAIDWATKNTPVSGEEHAMLSNRAALCRAELLSDLGDNPRHRDLLHSYRAGYHSAKRWIERAKVDLLLVFNGRIDITRGITDAAAELGIDYMSYERTWFGNGIHMLPSENCLGLRTTHELCREVRDWQLTEPQREAAIKIVEGRVNRTSSNEWRDFQTRSDGAYAGADNLPASSGRVLVLPSSSYEFWGHPDWETEWESNFQALDYMQAELGIPWSEFLVRGHPIWSQVVGKASGRFANEHYRKFCDKRGITYIEPDSQIHTSNLIEACDLVLLNGGSSVLEAIWRGKPVISLGANKYEQIGVCPTVKGPGQEFVIPDNVARREQILKFVHTMDQVAPTFVNTLKAISSYEQQAYHGASFDDVVKQVRSGSLSFAGKNQAPPGAPLARNSRPLDQARKLLRLGDR